MSIAMTYFLKGFMYAFFGAACWSLIRRLEEYVKERREKKGGD
jgi:hypothetical protein